MRGTITKRNNRWQAMWYTHRKIDGKPERKSRSGFATKKEAEREMDRYDKARRYD